MRETGDGKVVGLFGITVRKCFVRRNGGGGGGDGDGEGEGGGVVW